jgi:hypothetical protein
MFNSSSYNPDVLTCLANLSSDEVFTPPKLVNQMLDLLPETIWCDKDARFLDLACKSGVFLREITKRLVEPHTADLSMEQFGQLFDLAIVTAAEAGHVWRLPEEFKPDRERAARAKRPAA